MRRVPIHLCSLFRKITASSTVRQPDIRRAASSLAAATSDLVVAVRAPQHNESVNVFVNSYTDFHTAVSEGWVKARLILNEED